MNLKDKKKHNKKTSNLTAGLVRAVNSIPVENDLTS